MDSSPCKGMLQNPCGGDDVIQCHAIAKHNHCFFLFYREVAVVILIDIAFCIP
jgi:hypothetical protein